MPSITEFLSNLNLFQKKKVAVLGIDIGSSSIKVVQLKKKKGVAVLETYGELALGPYSGIEAGRSTSLSTQEISRALTDLLREARVDVSDCCVSVPLGSSLISVMDMPDISEKELNQMIPIEARKYIPFPISEVFLDWKIIPKKESAYTEDVAKEDLSVGKEKVKVLVAAVHQEAIEKYKRIIEGAKLNLKFWEIEIFSTIRSVVDFEPMTVAILDIGAGMSKLYIVEYGIVHSSHSINKGSQNITLAIAGSLGVDISSAEKKKREIGVSADKQNEAINSIVTLNLEYIFEEANRSILSYQKKYNKNVNKVILTGGGAIVKNLLSFASSRLEADVVIADPFSKVETPAFLSDVLKDAGPEFAVAIGLAIRGLDQME